MKEVNTLPDAKKRQPAPYIVVPEGSKLVDVERFESCPRRMKQRIRSHSIESLIEYAKHWKSPMTVGFWANGTLVIVFDYGLQVGLNNDPVIGWMDHWICLHPAYADDALKAKKLCPVYNAIPESLKGIIY